MDTKALYSQGEFTELFLRHLTRDNTLLGDAKLLGMRGDDLIASDTYGVVIYKVFANICFQIGTAPIDQDLFLTHIKNALTQGSLYVQQTESILKLWQYLYEGELTVEYFREHLPAFLRYKREEKTKLLYADDTDRLRGELNKVAIEFETHDLASQASVVHPFAQVLKKKIVNLIPTGFLGIDKILGGLGYGEFGIVVGYSGGGKTCFATGIATRVAMTGKKVTFISMEESVEDISNRFYSQIYKINYSSLHNGSGYPELEQLFDADYNTDSKNMLTQNLSILGLKGLTPITADQIKKLLDARFAKDGFAPDVVIIDQLQFMEPNSTEVEDQEWLKEKKIAQECDELSHCEIGGNRFGLWLLHQARGDLKKTFTHSCIAGFKGVIHSADTVLGIGREKQTSNDFTIFSLKSRHSKNFEVPYVGEMEFMSFREAAEGPTSQGELLGICNTSPETPTMSRRDKLAQLMKG